MKSSFFTLLLIPLVTILTLAGPGYGDEAKKEADPKGKTYLLRYHFKPGETVRWNVFRQGRTQTSVSGTTQISETITKSTKMWKIIEVNKDGSFVFENQTEGVDMWHKMTGCDEVHFNSKEDKEPPHGFEGALDRIGKPLARITLDPLGNIKKRVELVEKHTEDEKVTPLTIPLPKEAISLGHVWRIRDDVYVSLENKTTKKIRIHQAFTLKEVKDDVATIDVQTQILTPVHNPEIEVKLINQCMHNTIRFDIKLGRIISQTQELDKKVIGFRGPDSSTHYSIRFTEKLTTLK